MPTKVWIFWDRERRNVDADIWISPHQYKGAAS